ncbi:hypothetical protein VFPPC_00991 [Pochonia chlamydosporia 170]|uniref:Uncharacterized protein n=1 Tax=Pochonia chlamydosporia 170 TaxID=1380566 RepID=A0A179G734_METCM|nr:hypothetical protein VFPPC_00991 [Pochonia chlamydosporia 170]OAQ73223.1 hypothetical protein VFPPC_00991 [Pochonia chlamydosporia 170]
MHVLGRNIHVSSILDGSLPALGRKIDGVLPAQPLAHTFNVRIVHCLSIDPSPMTWCSSCLLMQLTGLITSTDGSV